jgi:hypothetical protein
MMIIAVASSDVSGTDQGETMQTIQRFTHIVGLAVAGLVAASGLAQAQLTNADVGLDETNTQTGDTIVTSTGGFFSARAFFTNTNDSHTAF